MIFMQIKTNELTGAALDWAVAKCEGKCEGDFAWYYDRRHTFNYSTDWSQGGPIIERDVISIDSTTMRGEGGNFAWRATRIEGPAVSEEYGLTPLIAAMRCYVSSQLGDTVDIPEELLEAA